MKVHLVDGTYELFRAYYGAPSRAGDRQQEVGAARSLAGSLLSLVTKEGATHVAVAFDHVIESFRNELFDGYKTGNGIEPDLWAQFSLAEDLTRALGFVCWPMVEFEADDALATAAFHLRQNPEVEQVLLCSPDKDLMQCVVGTEVVSVDRRRGITYAESDVIEKMGVAPESIPDYLALVGDSADGIPGIPKWGAKSSATVLQTYRYLENIPDDLEQWTVKVRGQSGLAQNLTQYRQEAELFKTLATLRTDLSLDLHLSTLEWKGGIQSQAKKISEILSDPKLLTRIPRWQ